MNAYDLKGFFAAILNMGIIQLPNLESYWKTSWSGNIPFFGSLVSRDRFLRYFGYFTLVMKILLDLPKKLTRCAVY